MQEGSRKAIAAAFLANLGIALAKFAGFAVTGAASLLAEAIHSVADTGNQALLFLGGRRARRRPTAEHPFGFGQERYFWAFIVALMLFSLGGLFAVVEGVDKLVHPHELESFPIALAVLLVAVVLEAFSFRTATRQAREVRGDASWWQYIRRSKSPELPVVLLEDTGALLGLFLAIVGVSAAEITGNSRWDALGSIGIGILLVVIAIVLAKEMKSLLIGESASSRVLDAIRTALVDGEDVRRVIHLRTLHLGPEELLVAAKVDIDTPSVSDLARAIDAAEARVRAAVPIARVIYLEPDVYRPDAVVKR
ncbi:MAG TPA: cation diffusion facilitator family transporter [Acidimicrobiia bacterium]|nr:cation diffusion facilitator family transporter [Acidimicrobiia bacterium]